MNVAVFTVIKDERDYLDDFLRYHTEMGLHIFVYEDLFSVSHKDICDMYPDVELHSVTELYEEEEMDELVRKRTEKVPCQTEFINRGLRYVHSLGRYDWLWLIDIDEYITSTEPISSVLGRFNDRDAVLVYWKNYGCSGHLYKPVYDKPIWKIYTEPCGYEQYSDYKYFKITKFCINMQRYNPTMKIFIHNAAINWIKADGSVKRTQPVFEPLYLRHYITKSWEEFCYKILIRGTFHQGHRQYRSFFEMEPDMEEKIRNEKGFKDYFFNKYGVMPDY